MHNEREIELMNKAIDGILSEDEAKEFDQVLKSNEELKRNYDEMTNSIGLIKNLPDYYPSPNIKKNIMDTIEAEEVKADRKEKSNNEKFLFAKFFQPKYRYAFFISIVLIASVLFLWITSNQKIENPNSVSGFMGKSESMLINYDQLYTTDLVGIESSLGIYKYNDTLAVSFDKKNEDKITLGYSFHSDSVVFIGVRENPEYHSVVNRIEGRASVMIDQPCHVLALFLINNPKSLIDMQIRNSERQIFRYKFSASSKNYHF